MNDVSKSEICHLLMDIFGDERLVEQWLKTAIPALGGEVPEQMLVSIEGREILRRTLNKIKAGEYIS